MNFKHEKARKEYEKEYEEWLASTFACSPTTVVTKLEKRLLSLEQKVEELCQLIEKSNSTDLDDWNRSKDPSNLL